MESMSMSYMIQKGLINYANSKINEASGSLKTYADQKDFLNFDPKMGVYGDQSYNFEINGLTLTLPEKYIFLGGYCSLMPTQSLTLPPNQTSYIYFTRNQSNRDIIDVSISNTPIGGEGVQTFNKYHVAKAVTNNNSVTSVQYYIEGR